MPCIHARGFDLTEQKVSLASEEANTEEEIMKKSQSKKFNVTILDIMLFTLFILHICVWTLILTSPVTGQPH